jgi:aminocarboxymuconate-semialdehyde decarboxylase
MVVDLFKCGENSKADARSGLRKRSDGGAIIDIHCHLGVPAAAALVDVQYQFTMPAAPGPSDLVTAEMMREVSPRLNGLELRLQDMDRLGIDVQVLSPNPGQYYYGAPVESGREAARLVNNTIAEAVARHPDRFAGLGTVPLQDCQAAIAEMRRCREELGLRGVEIGTNVRGEELSSPELVPFFRAAEDLDMMLFLHPMGFSEPRRLTNHLANIIGNPLDTTVALSHLIFSGALERHPGLKICAAHGGGYLPAYAGRMDHAYHHRSDCRLCVTKPPSEYLANVYFDTLVYDRAQVDALINRWGAERLCMGSDYPFDMAEPDPVGFHDHLKDEVRNLILGGNAERLLGKFHRSDK